MGTPDRSPVRHCRRTARSVATRFPSSGWAVAALFVGSLLLGTLLAPTLGVAIGTAAAGQDGASPLDRDAGQTGALEGSGALDGSGARVVATSTSVVDLSVSGNGQSAANWLDTAADAVPGESIVLLGAYSRYDDRSALEHPVRAEVNDVVRRMPGLHFAEVVRRVGSPEGTVRYHTRVLERDGHLQTATEWGTLRLYPATTDAEDFELYAALRDDARSRVLRGIARGEPATVTALAEALDRAASTVSHHVTRLDEAGLVDRERTGQSVEISLEPGVRDRLEIASGATDEAADAVGIELAGD